MILSLVFGIFDILAGLFFFVLCIIKNRPDRIIMALFLLLWGVRFVVNYINNKKKQTCWRNPTKKEMAKILGTNIYVNRKCCENCAYVEFYTVRGSQTINKICNYNPVRPMVGNHSRHVCNNWCPGAGSVVFKIKE